MIGALQRRARLPSRGDAERAMRAALETLGERVSAGAADNLAAQLPTAIGAHLRATAGVGGLQPEAYDSAEFIDRVGRREGTDRADAAFHVRAVLEVLDEATQGTLDKVREQLPDDYDRLFDAGSQGSMPG